MEVCRKHFGNDKSKQLNRQRSRIVAIGEKTERAEPFHYNWQRAFETQGKTKAQLTHHLHKLVIVLTSVHFPGAIECHVS